MLNRQQRKENYAYLYDFTSALTVCLISKQIDNKFYSYNYFGLLAS